jgi:hypothetical protein
MTEPKPGAATALERRLVELERRVEALEEKERRDREFRDRLADAMRRRNG